MLEFTAESAVVEASGAEESEELAVHAGNPAQPAGNVHPENLEDMTTEPEADAMDLDAADHADAEEEESQVRGELQTREAYLKKGEDLIRSLL
jgi:hypothetical protein